MPNIIYKGKLYALSKSEGESNAEFEKRKWFILKNISNNNNSKKHPDYILSELDNLSKIYIKYHMYECIYDEDIMKKIKKGEKNLYIY